MVFLIKRIRGVLFWKNRKFVVSEPTHFTGSDGEGGVCPPGTVPLTGAVERTDIFIPIPNKYSQINRGLRILEHI